MATVHRENGFRFAIFSNDHAPEHVHVRDAGGSAKITIGNGQDGPQLVRSSGMSRSRLRAAVNIVAENRDAFLEKWRTIHG